MTVVSLVLSPAPNYKSIDTPELSRYSREKTTVHFRHDPQTDGGSVPTLVQGPAVDPLMVLWSLTASVRVSRNSK